MRTLLCAIVALVGFSAIGCGDGGPATAPVTGKVTFDGKPYANAIVTYSPVGGGPSAIGKSNENGEYEVFTVGKKGAVLGSHKVSVITEVTSSSSAQSAAEIRSDDPEYAKKMAAASRGQSSSTVPKEPLPAKYNTKTELTFEVKSGKNVNDLTLDK